MPTTKLDTPSQSATMSRMAPKIDPDKYLTIGTAAKMAGVSRLWMRTLVKGGHVSGVEIDGQWFANVAAVKAYAATHNATGRPRGGKHMG